MNSIILTGRLTADAELRVTESDNFITRFTLAVRRPLAKDATDFIHCVAWRQNAEFLSKYARRGTRIGVRGALQTRKYIDRDGNERTGFEVSCDTVEILESKKETGEEEGTYNPYDDSGVGKFLPVDDDMPF